MTKFTFLEHFVNNDELTKWKIANKFSWGTTKSSLIKCTICPGANHKMRCVVASCSNKGCNQGESCPKRYKICTCQSTQKVKLHEEGEHIGQEFKFKTHGLTTKVKELIEDLIDRQGNQPKLIHIKLTCKKKWRSKMFNALYLLYYINI